MMFLDKYKQTKAPSAPSSPRSTIWECDFEEELSQELIQQPRKQSKRRTRFSEDVLVFDLPASELSKEDKKKMWYNKNDYTRFSAQDKELAREFRIALRKGHQTQRFCVRGLEAQLSIRANVEARNRNHQCRVAVLCEQSRQDKLGITDSRLIRKQCVAATRTSRVEAFTLAKSDAACVMPSRKVEAIQMKRVDKSPIKPRRKKLQLREEHSMHLSIDIEQKSMVLGSATRTTVAANRPVYAF